MPELPEVEVLVRHLAPLLKGKTIRAVTVHREKVIRPDSARKLERQLVGAKFLGVERRAKFLVFTLSRPSRQTSPVGKRGALPLPAGSRTHVTLLGHLGMTGRMYLQPAKAPLPRHAAVSFDLGRTRFVYEDTRYFGRLTTDLSVLDSLGPEPFADAFSPEYLATELKRFAQAIKVKLLDQSLVAGIGNIYASEALFRAGISPRKAAHRLKKAQVGRLHATIQEVLREAIDCGSTIPLDFAGTAKRNGLFYYGQIEESSAYYQERLLVYDRVAQSCTICRTPIRRIVQAARSTYFCPNCQRG
jgi:formamidopyrimidine-DNA glycosylase